MSVSLAPGTTVVIDAQLKDGRVTQSVTPLKIEVSSFKYDIGGNRGVFTGATDQSVTDDDTNYVYIDKDGVLQINTTGFPSGVSYIPLARVPTANGEIVNVIPEHIHFSGSSAAPGECYISLPVDGGIKGGNAGTSSNNYVASVTFDDVGESRNRWNIHMPKNYIDGNFTFRCHGTVAGSPGSNAMRLGVSVVSVSSGGTLPTNYDYSTEVEKSLSGVSSDEDFISDITIPATEIDITKDWLGIEFFRNGDHDDDTTTLTYHTHLCGILYNGYTVSGQPGQ